MGEAFFSFMAGDDLLEVLRDASRWAREHNEPAIIVYGARRYEVHHRETSDAALKWLLRTMQKNHSLDCRPMTSLSTLLDLRERVRKASGSDRELDGTLWLVLEPEAAMLECSFKGFKYAGQVFTKAEKAAWVNRTAGHRSPLLTASIDAALALVERVLPDVNCYGFDRYPTRTEASVSRNHVSEGHWSRVGEGKTPSLAILDAALSALIAQKEADA